MALDRLQFGSKRALVETRQADQLRSSLDPELPASAMETRAHCAFAEPEAVGD